METLKCLEVAEHSTLSLAQSKVLWKMFHVKENQIKDLKIVPDIKMIS